MPEAMQTMATREMIAKMLALWTENWPNHETNKNTGMFYEHLLVDVPDSALERAAMRCLEDLVFWPRVAEVFERVRWVETPAEKAKRDSARWRREMIESGRGAELRALEAEAKLLEAGQEIEEDDDDDDTQF